jgi:hypothetical protein
LSEAKLSNFEDVEALTLPRIIGATDSELEQVAEKMSIPYLRTAVLEMLSVLPPIISLGDFLPKKSVPGFESLAQYEPESNSWVETSNIDRIGAFRVRGEYRNRYVIRTAKDLESNSISFVSAELAKHYQSALLGRALFAYDYTNHKLIVPLGATLPGLYGRAAVLASGKLPERDSTGKLLIYHNIDSKISRLFAAKLGRTNIG